MELKRNIEMYGISRMDNDVNSTHAWRVSLVRCGKKHIKNFPDKRFGGSNEALVMAKIHRDKLVVQYPAISRREYCEVKRRNNKSGITGVYRYGKPYTLKDGTIKRIWYWEANWPDENGKSVCKSFRVSIHGEEGAKQRAMRARKDGMSTVKGTFWAASPKERVISAG